jgi:hypothetical protein
MPFARLKNRLDQVRFKARIWRTVRSGPPYVPRPDRIIIDLCHCCDLSCPDCNRSCAVDQAPADEFISLEQVRRFVSESVASNRRWRKIMLEGGEPTLHPELQGILALLRDYRARHAPECVIELCTNGHGPRARRVLDRAPGDIQIKDSAKSAGRPKRHFAFNVAPADLPAFSRSEYGHGCYIQPIFGLGLTRHGYYPHPICGGIDRVFGFDIGLKSLPAAGADLSGQMRRLCPLCGHFWELQANGRRWLALARHNGLDRFPQGHKSPSWIRAYRDFREKRPELSLY